MFAFPNQDKSPVFKFLLGLSQSTNEFGYYFFSPGQVRKDIHKIFQGHHIIPTNVFTDSEFEEFFDKIYDRGYRQDNELASVGRIE